MISVVIPALNAEARLSACLGALVAATVKGLVREVIIVDGGSTDRTVAIADGYGARVLTAAPGRGEQLGVGASAARSDWLLFLHADTVLDPRWAEDADMHMQTAAERAAVFTLAFASEDAAAKIVSAGAMLRTRLFRLPYGDQGLLISRRQYNAIGGYRPMPLFEDVDLIRRLTKASGRGAFQVLPAKATTSAERYERLGYATCVARNNLLLARFMAGASPHTLAAAYR